jgi:hypothetical protein
MVTEIAGNVKIDVNFPANFAGILCPRIPKDLQQVVFFPTPCEITSTFAILW